MDTTVDGTNNQRKVVPESVTNWPFEPAGNPLQEAIDSWERIDCRADRIELTKGAKANLYIKLRSVIATTSYQQSEHVQVAVSNLTLDESAEVVRTVDVQERAERVVRRIQSEVTKARLRPGMRDLVIKLIVGEFNQ